MAAFLYHVNVPAPQHPSHSLASTAPWPLPPNVRDVLLVGGTFDPPHRAHITIPTRVRDSVAPSAWLLFVPAARSPFKVGQAQTSPAHRVAMLQLALASTPHAAVWTDEVDRAAANPDAPSYTIDTVRRALTAASDVNLRLVIGSDQAASFHDWRNARALMELARPLVMLREPVATAKALDDALHAGAFWSGSEIRSWLGNAVDTGPTDPANATAIRSAIRAHGTQSVPEGWLNAQVAAYIDQHNLYRERATR